MSVAIIDRTGEVGTNNQGVEMRVIACRGRLDLDVEFNDGFIKRNVTYSNFKNGRIKNPYAISVYGVGFLGEGPAIVSVNGKQSRQYSTWAMMIQRCYKRYPNSNNETYSECYVCDEWHNFQEFAKWYNDNFYQVEREVMNLDKDIICKGNKMYCPEMCAFVPSRINLLLLKGNKKRGMLPIGVSMSRKTIMMQCCSVNGKNVSAAFETVDQAFHAYKKNKERIIRSEANAYKGIIPSAVYNGLNNYEVNIND